MKKSVSIILPLLIASIALSGCGNEEEAVSKETVSAVEVQEMASSSMYKTVSYAGKVAANQTVTVTPKAAGKVKSISHDVGDRVKKGDVLFTIDTKDVTDQIAQLEASLQISQAGVASAQTALNQSTNGGQIQTTQLQLENSVENAEKSLESAQVAVDNAQVSIDNAKVSIETTKASADTARASFEDNEKKHTDYKVMYDAGVISKSDFDAIELAYTSSKNSYEQAENAYIQAQNALSQAENGLTSAQKQYEQAENAYNQAKDSLEIFKSKTLGDNKETAANSVNSAVASRNSVQTQINVLKSTLADYTVTSPIDGVVSSRNLEVSNMVSSASVPFVIADTDTVTIDVSVSEKIINNIKVGDSADVSISTSDENITGTIKTINTVADSTGTYAVQITVDNKGGLLKPGMFANVSLVSERSENTFVVPRNTVIDSNGNEYVFIVDSDSKAHKTNVSTGLDDGENIEITAGINKGDKIVIKGQSYLSDNETVNVVSSGEAEQ